MAGTCTTTGILVRRCVSENFDAVLPFMEAEVTPESCWWHLFLNKQEVLLSKNKVWMLVDAAAMKEPCRQTNWRDGVQLCVGAG